MLENSKTRITILCRYNNCHERLLKQLTLYHSWFEYFIHEMTLAFQQHIRNYANSWILNITGYQLISWFNIAIQLYFFWITCLISSKRFANLGQFHLLLFCAKIASLHGLDLYLHFISILNVCWKHCLEFRSTLQNKDMTLCNLKIWKCTSFNL